MSPPSPARTGPRAHLTAVIGLMFGFFFLCAGTPGTRWIGPKFLKRKRGEINRRAGPAAPLVFGFLEANKRFRVPIAKHLLPLQSFFRIAQNWGLYGAGPKRLRRLHIEVDGQPVYITNDDELTWLAPQLTHRKVRPMPDTMTAKSNAFNWRGFSRWILEAARADFPEAQEVTILAVFQDRGPGAERTIHHGRRARAPEWTWEHLGKGGVEIEPEEPTGTTEGDQ